MIVNAALQDIAGDLQCIAEELVAPTPLRANYGADFLSRKLAEYQEVKDGKR